MKQTRLSHNLSQKLFVLAAAIGAAAVPTAAMAHQVQTNYILNSQEGNSLELQTTFSNGQPLKGAKVTVYSPEQPFRAQVVGKTDSEGRFTFTPEQAVTGDWEVNIKQAGHQDILTVPVNEEGIDLELLASNGVVDQGGSDVHYAGSPLAAVGGLVVAAVCVGFARMDKKSRQ
ncbi:MAG: carboxypeptidase regulatory-like domain-containing protein [Cyanobacteria bacterium J06614_10]